MAGGILKQCSRGRSIPLGWGLGVSCPNPQVYRTLNLIFEVFDFLKYSAIKVIRRVSNILYNSKHFPFELNKRNRWRFIISPPFARGLLSDRRRALQ